MTDYGNFSFRYIDTNNTMSPCYTRHQCEVEILCNFSLYVSSCTCGRWVHFGKDLELLDSPGILPMRISDQTAAIKLAICDDIGERSYVVADIAAVLVQMLTRLPSVGMYHISLSTQSTI